VDTSRALALCEHYRHALLDDVVPFWLEYSLDREHGGYLTLLDRDGSIYGTDKAMWLQARETWLFATLYNTLERRDEWLQAARLGYDFLRRHGFDRDGRMFFSTTRDGRPLRKRRYLFTETFGVIACAQYAQAVRSDEAWHLATKTFDLVVDLYQDPTSHPEVAASLAPKTIPRTRRTRSHAMPMILLATAQELRRVQPDAPYDRVIDQALGSTHQRVAASIPVTLSRRRGSCCARANTATTRAWSRAHFRYSTGHWTEGGTGTRAASMPLSTSRGARHSNSSGI